MLHYKKLGVAAMLIAFMIIGMAATRPLEDKPRRNLKVLPKDISDDDLDKIMDSWKIALGVKCSFCHAPFKDISSRHLDFASDPKPDKDITLHIFRLTA